MGDLVAHFILGVIDALAEFLFRALYAVIERLACFMWRLLSPARRDRRTQKIGLRFIYDDARRLADIAIGEGAYAGKLVSEIPLDIAVSFQKTWPHLIGRAAIARWLDRNKPGWRRTRRQQRRDAFIPEGPAR